MAKVKKTFFCTETKRKYFPGDEYDGDRKDLAHVLEYEDKSIQPKTKKKRGRPARRKTKK